MEKIDFHLQIQFHPKNNSSRILRQYVKLRMSFRFKCRVRKCRNFLKQKIFPYAQIPLDPPQQIFEISLRLGMLTFQHAFEIRHVDFFNLSVAAMTTQIYCLDRISIFYQKYIVLLLK